MREKWEYKLWSIFDSTASNPGEVTVLLNSFGADGWEIVGMVESSRTFIMKRPRSNLHQV